MRDEKYPARGTESRERRKRASWDAIEIENVKVAQSCPALCNPMDYIVHGILQTRILEWVAVPFSRGFFPYQG